MKVYSYDVFKDFGITKKDIEEASEGYWKDKQARWKKEHGSQG